MIYHSLRAAVFFFPVRVLISGLLLWGGVRAVRARLLGAQVFLAAVSVGWAWIQFRHDLVL